MARDSAGVRVGQHVIGNPLSECGKSLEAQDLTARVLYLDQRLHGEKWPWLMVMMMCLPRKEWVFLSLYCTKSRGVPHKNGFLIT